MNKLSLGNPCNRTLISTRDITHGGHFSRNSSVCFSGEIWPLKNRFFVFNFFRKSISYGLTSFLQKLFIVYRFHGMLFWKLCFIGFWQEIFNFNCQYKVSLKDRKTSRELRERCGLESIGDSLHKRRLSWFGHVERMDDNNCVKRSRQFVVPGNRGRGRPQMTWDQVVSNDLAQRGIQPGLAQDRLRWKGAISKPV